MTQEAHSPAVYRVDWAVNQLFATAKSGRGSGANGETLPDPLQLSVLGRARERPLSQRKVRRRAARGLPRNGRPERWDVAVMVDAVTFDAPLGAVETRTQNRLVVSTVVGVDGAARGFDWRQSDPVGRPV